MSEGPTIGDWTQYGWIPDGASSFPAMVRLRNAAWMVYYEPGTVVQRERAENVKLRELVRDMWHDARLLDANGHIDGMRLSDSKAEDYKRRMEELGVEV